MSDLQTRELLDVAEVSAMFGVGPRTIQRWVGASLFPQPIRFNRRVFRWRMSDIEDFIDKQTPKN